MAASVGLIAFVSDGPILRPAVSASPADLTRILIVSLAIAWPLVTATATSHALVAGQGAMLLATAVLAIDREIGECALPLTAWLLANVAAATLRWASGHWRWPSESVWTVALIAAVLAAVQVLG